jgi:hypothetical protein
VGFVLCVQENRGLQSSNEDLNAQLMGRCVQEGKSLLEDRATAKSLAEELEHLTKEEVQYQFSFETLQNLGICKAPAQLTWRVNIISSVKKQNLRSHFFFLMRKSRERNSCLFVCAPFRKTWYVYLDLKALKSKKRETSFESTIIFLCTVLPPL